MPILNIKKQKSDYTALNKRLAQYVLLIQSIYEKHNLTASQAALLAGYSADLNEEFKIKNYPELKATFDKIQKQFVSEISTIVLRGTSDEWKRSNIAQDALASELLKDYQHIVGGQKEYDLYQSNSDALKAFQERRDRGMNLSDKIWQQSEDYKQELEAAISTAIEKGTSAVTLSKQVSKYLLNFNLLQKDYKEKFGKSADIKDCEYKSIRLARSEINMAYRNAEQERWKQMDFILGYEVHLSKNHNCKGVPAGHFVDICDELQGRYPKNFKWSGWHPNCYHKDTKLLTNRGWLLFSEVQSTDLVLSLNPATKQCEWVGITAKQAYQYTGEMLRFHSKTLDCIVTPDHSMVYLSKSNKNKIKRKKAQEYSKTNGAFYRSCLYNSSDIQSIKIGTMVLNFDLFCEFMAYWLADGSLAKNNVVLHQNIGENARESMSLCLHRLGFSYNEKYDRITFYNSQLAEYLSKFGKSFNKYIPKEILNASQRQIRIFLNAFILCDGYKRKPKSFIGNHNTLFTSKKEEKLYFTTSPILASNLCEAILKSGNRPSFSIKQPKTTTTKDNHVINSNHECYVIRECYSKSASEFTKTAIQYDDYVYDVTLERNHIMYVSFNGKCFWGSNCRCYAVPILMDDDTFVKWNNGEDVKDDSIKDMPENFNEWAIRNADRIHNAEKRKTLPYFVKDNKKITNEILSIDVLSLKQIENALKKDLTTEKHPILMVRDDFTNARKKVQQNIINEYIKGYNVQSDTIYMLGGAPANGKSTLVESGLLPHPKGSLIIDADKVKSMIPEYDKMIKSGNKNIISAAANFVHEESSIIGKNIQQLAFSNNLSTVIDGVNDGSFEKVSERVAHIKNTYHKKVRADYVTLDTDLSIKLAKARAEKTGRNVPIEFIEESNREISKLIPQLIENSTFDELYLWDTNINGTPRLILKQIDGVLKIKNKDLYLQFLKKAN